MVPLERSASILTALHLMQSTTFEILVDPSGSILSVDEMFYKCLEYSAKDIVGKSLKEIVPEAERVFYGDALESVSLSGQTKKMLHLLNSIETLQAQFSCSGGENSLGADTAALSVWRQALKFTNRKKTPCTTL